MAKIAGSDIEITGAINARYEEILTSEALGLLEALQRRFDDRRIELLQRRVERQARIDRGELPDFLSETAEIRAGDWKVAPLAPGIVDRRVEITGPPERKMTINALNSGAKVWMADFEDANTPIWANVIEGQINLADALDRTITFDNPDGRVYSLDATPATVLVRPRGWHLSEKHLLLGGSPVSGGLCDFSLYMVASARRQLELGHGPYFYLPKIESHLEARLWNEVFDFTEEALGFSKGTIRATVLVETLPAAFEMDEILYELREHSAGLNAGRWDYLFSIIKKFRNLGNEFVLPDRNSVTMAAPFMRSYTELLVQTCHSRGAHAIGGMAAFIPSRRDPEATKIAIERVYEDKRREANAGFDGSWVAHPDLVPICREVFTEVLKDKPNQIDRLREDVHVVAKELLDIASAGGARTEAGLRNDVSVALQYLASWLNGSGAVAIFNLMEDAATAEIARSQVWQWLHVHSEIEGIGTLTAGIVNRVIDEELEKISVAFGSAYDEELFARARELFLDVALRDDYFDFLTTPAYAALT